MAQAHLQVDDCMAVELWWNVENVSAKNILHAQIDANYQVTPANADAITSALNTLATTSGLLAMLPTLVFSPNVHLRDLRQIGMPLVDSTIAGVAGTATTDLLPRQIGACLTLRTDRAGRQFRGRMYVPGFSETANDATNHMTAACKLALDNYAAGLRTAINQAGVTLSVLHRPLFDQDGNQTAPGSMRPVNQVVCRDNIWDTQRRRAR